jgi:hypothetical protein
LLSHLLGVLDTYELIKEKEDSYVLTDLGHRALLHISDTEKYVEAIMAAHRGLQKVKPKLSLL